MRKFSFGKIFKILTLKKINFKKLEKTGLSEPGWAIKDFDRAGLGRFFLASIPSINSQKLYTDSFSLSWRVLFEKGHFRMWLVHKWQPWSAFVLSFISSTSVSLLSFRECYRRILVKKSCWKCLRISRTFPGLLERQSF